VPPQYFEKPLYVVRPSRISRTHPAGDAAATGRVGVATIVMRGRQHLAALIADDTIITLELLRFSHEIKAVAELEAGDALEAPEVKEKELQLAEQLVAALDEPWSPEQFRDEYRGDLLELIEQKAKTGRAPVKSGAAARQRAARSST